MAGTAQRPEQKKRCGCICVKRKCCRRREDFAYKHIEEQVVLHNKQRSVSMDATVPLCYLCRFLRHKQLLL